MKKKEFILNDILSKIYQQHFINGKLPTQRNLAKDYQVSRYTIQTVIDQLADIGVIKSVQGSGIFIKKNVRQNPLIYNSITATPYSRLTSKPIYLRKVKATDKDRRMFELEKSEEVWEFQRIRIANYQIVQIETSRLPYRAFFDLSVEDLKDSIQEFVQKKGYKISHNITTYKPTIVDKNQAELLSCKKGIPAMYIQNRSLLNNGVIYEYSEVIALDYSCTYLTPFNKEVHQSRKQD
ncbi:GntR family transcriptional regulator [Mammaliicoccus sciuri]|uniref:GntR family transcriptional regulator n=1 Tax=Mammaliicoccus sciuri TaxID=1296 RepID=A0AAI8GUK3_MAMSC|nr:GntR family transcriptional regulator [Mammaliicoccus sciuri]OOV38716.1 GntR family transcriptional regulator [Staphylococcus sp. MB371]PCQ20066.1 GntR family transcriptional regulator [Klebsiella pneumoniae]HCW36015.1 GntR family transcriptional regulator [Staphylococcus sp.]ASE35145.1 GntR family transcriptional regulator [Mammaliicoccus sciuri]KTT87192.1 GntR family transcriptional regulator [Mammaliicoccus sciuri]